MPWFSILPERIGFIETWAIRIFVMLGIIIIGPWILLLIYDIILFLFRIILWNFPIFGGHARNRPRPRAPSLRNRPGGRSRSLSFTLPAVSSAPASPRSKSATGVEEQDENRKVIQRLRKEELPTHIPAQTSEQLQDFLERHSWEDLEQIDKTAIANQTGLTTNQVREWFILAQRGQREETEKLRSTPF